MNKILFCKKCRAYTIKKNCLKCNEKTISPKPAKWSPQDKYSAYRIKAKFANKEF